MQKDKNSQIGAKLSTPDPSHNVPVLLKPACWNKGGKYLPVNKLPIYTFCIDIRFTSYFSQC